MSSDCLAETARACVRELESGACDEWTDSSFAREVQASESSLQAGHIIFVLDVLSGAGAITDRRHVYAETNFCGGRMSKLEKAKWHFDPWSRPIVNAQALGHRPWADGDVARATYGHKGVEWRAMPSTKTSRDVVAVTKLIVCSMLPKDIGTSGHFMFELDCSTLPEPPADERKFVPADVLRASRFAINEHWIESNKSAVRCIMEVLEATGIIVYSPDRSEVRVRWTAPIGK